MPADVNVNVNVNVRVGETVGVPSGESERRFNGDLRGARGCISASMQPTHNTMYRNNAMGKGIAQTDCHRVCVAVLYRLALVVPIETIISYR